MSHALLNEHVPQSLPIWPYRNASVGLLCTNIVFILIRNEYSGLLVVRTRNDTNRKSRALHHLQGLELVTLILSVAASPPLRTDLVNDTPAPPFITGCLITLDC